MLKNELYSATFIMQQMHFTLDKSKSQFCFQNFVYVMISLEEFMIWIYDINTNRL